MKVENSIRAKLGLQPHFPQCVLGRKIWGNRNLKKYHVEILPNDKQVSEIVNGIAYALCWQRRTKKRLSQIVMMRGATARALNEQALAAFGVYPQNLLWDGSRFTKYFEEMKK